MVREARRKEKELQGERASRHANVLQGAPQRFACGSDFVKVGWDRQHHEWKVHAISASLDFEGQLKEGYEPTNLTIDFHLSRRYGYFIYQILLPLYLTTILSWSVFLEETGEMSDRVNNSITCLIAQFALLYTVNQHLPNLEFLTIIDKSIVGCVTSTAVAGVVSVLGEHLCCFNGLTIVVAVYYIQKNDSADTAELVNDWAARLVIALGVAQFAFTVLPKWFGSKRKVGSKVGLLWKKLTRAMWLL